MSDMAPDPVTIHSVSFGDRWVEITWNDEKDVSTRSQQLHQDMIDPGLVEEPMAEVLDLLRDMLTTAAVERRDPPKSFRRSG